MSEKRKDRGEKRILKMVKKGKVEKKKRISKPHNGSREAYMLLFEQSTDGIAIISKKKIVMANEAFCAIHELPMEKVIGANPCDFIHSEDREAATKRIEALLQGKPIPESYVYRALKGDGSVIWAEVSTKKIEWEGEIALQSLVRDITERKKAEEMLWESQKRLELAVEIAGIGLWDQDFQTNEVFRSPQWAAMLGYAPEEITPELAAWKNLIHPDDLPLVNEAAKKHEEGQTPFFKIKHRLKTKTGEWKWILNWGKVFERDKDGKPLRAMGAHIDITERKKAEAGLRIKDQAIASSISGIVLLNLDGIITYVNQAYLDIFAYSNVEDAIGHKITEVAADKEIAQMILTAMQTQGWWRGEFRAPLRDGTAIDILLSASLVRNEEGVPIAMMGSIIDITERKKTEEELMRSEEHLRDAQALGRIGNWEFDITTDKIEWSDEAYELYERDKALGPPSTEEEALYYPPEEAARVREFGRLAIEKGEESRYDLTAQLPSGKTVFFNASMHPVKDDKGNVIKLFGTVQDITERKMMEVALQALEENFHNSLDNSPLGIRIVNKDGETLYANKAILDIYGYESTEEFKATPIRKRYTPESYEQHLVRRGKREKGELEPSDYEISIVRKDGTVRHLQIFRKEVLWGGMKQFQVLYADITERKKAEEALRAAEIKYRSLVERVPCVVYLTTFGKNAPWLYVSPQIETLLGFTAEEWRDDSTLWFRQIHSDDQERIANFEGTQTPYDFEYRMLTKEGRIVWVHDYAIILPNEKGEPYYQQGFLVDITERKRAEEKLSAIHRMTEELALSLDVDHIAGATADIVQDILEFRDFTIDLIDEEKQELRVKAYRGFFEKTDKKVSSLKENGITLWVANHGQSLLVPDVHKDERYVEWFPNIRSELCVPLKVKEKIIGVMDVESEKIDAFSEEDRMLLETLASGAAIAIENAQLYEETKQSKLQLEFVTDLMSHDLSNINQIALSSVEILSESELSEHQKKFLISTMSAVRRSAGLVSNFKVLQGMLRGQGEKEKKELSSIIEKAMKNFSDYPGKTITIEYVPQQGQIIMADDYLSKVFDNLFDNAIKFTPQEQVRIAVEVFEEKDCFKIRICDWGKGVSDKMKEEIFRRYEKLQEGKLGTGLGLYTAKKIVENHGGRIWVYDNPEGGSVFCVELPRFPAMLK